MVRARPRAALTCRQFVHCVVTLHISSAISVSAALSTLDCTSSICEGHVLWDAAGERLSWSPRGAAEGVPADAVVYGAFEDAISSAGVARLDVRTVAAAPTMSYSGDRLLFEALGLAEGVLTAPRIAQQLHNMLEETSRPSLYAFLHDHLDYLAAHSTESDDGGEPLPYWRAVGLFLARQRGMANGFRQRLDELSPELLAAGAAEEPTAGGDVKAVSSREAHAADFGRLRNQILMMPDHSLQATLLLLTLVSDVGELQRAIHIRNQEFLSPEELLSAKEAALRMQMRGHCSALIRASGSQLLVGHATWSTYSEMLRIWKDVSFPHISDSKVVNKRLSFSSYPGYFASTDDWLVMPDQKMLVLETTTDCLNDTLLAQHVWPDTVNTPLRSLVASLLASGPEQWCSIFSQQSSGTQNNQWMVLSLAHWQEHVKQLEAGDVASSALVGAAPAAAPAAVSKAPQDVLWVLEQQPGTVVYKDKTSTLLEDGYWASFNVPHFKETLHASSYLEEESSVFRCEEQRAPLLAAAKKNVTSMSAMRDLLITNNWKRDPLSWSCPKCAVAARFDLAGTNASIGSEFSSSSHMPGCGASDMFGAIDAKVADDRMLVDGQSFFVSGPPRIGVPPFNWATAAGPAALSARHAGQPTGPWQFPWLRMGGESIHRNPSTRDAVDEALAEHPEGSVPLTVGFIGALVVSSALLVSSWRARFRSERLGGSEPLLDTAGTGAATPVGSHGCNLPAVSA